MAGAPLTKTRLAAVNDGAPQTPRWQEDSLGFLVAPMTREEFLKTVYEQHTLLRKNGDSTRFVDLLSLEAVDHFIAAADLREGMLDVTNKRNPVTHGEYINSGGRIITTVVAEKYLAGATIILPGLHDSMFNLGEFCRSLEEVFTCHVQTNIYLTPPGNQGFNPHYDNHDVFIVQVHGAKDWRIYGTPIATPFRGEGFRPGQIDPGEPTQRFTLEAGDCVYIPRGVMHDAESIGDEPSLHITVGFLTKTWADLMLESISELAISEPDFRRSLPAGYATRDFDREIARQHFEKLTHLVAERASMDSAFDLMADSFIRDRRPNLSQVISTYPAPPLEGETYRRRRFVPWNVADDEGKIALIGPGGDLSFTAEEGDALDVALSGEPFQLAQLACEDPVALFRKLWSNGYLERVPA